MDGLKLAMIRTEAAKRISKSMTYTVGTGVKFLTVVSERYKYKLNYDVKSKLYTMIRS